MHRVGSKMGYWVLGNAKIGSKVGFCGSLPGSLVAPGITYAVPGDSHWFSEIEWSVLELQWTPLNILRAGWRSVKARQLKSNEAVPVNFWDDERRAIIAGKSH